MAANIVSPARAVLYGRFSPRRNADECQSNETQLFYCREYCEKHGYTIVGEFQDDALSGDDENRPGLWSAVEKVPRGGVLVVYRQDRLARSVYLDEYIRRCVVKRGARIEVVSGTRNGDAPEDVFIRQIMAAYAEMEKRIISARTKAAMLRHQYQAGRLMSKVPPYGYRPAPDQVVNGRVQRMIEADASELAVIDRIREMRTNGHTRTYREIAQLLTDEGTLCRGKAWNFQTVRKIHGRQS